MQNKTFGTFAGGSALWFQEVKGMLVVTGVPRTDEGCSGPITWDTVGADQLQSINYEPS